MEVERIAQLTTGDADAFLAAVRANSEYLGRWLDTPKRVVTREDAIRELSVETRYGCFVAGELVASIKVIKLDSPGSVELGVWGVERHEGHGHVRATLAVVLAILRASGINTVLYRHAPENRRSEALIANLMPSGYSSTRLQTPEETLWTLCLT